MLSGATGNHYVTMHDTSTRYAFPIHEMLCGATGNHYVTMHDKSTRYAFPIHEMLCGATDSHYNYVTKQDIWPGSNLVFFLFAK